MHLKMYTLMTLPGLNVMELADVNRAVLEDNFVLIYLIESLLELENWVNY